MRKKDWIVATLQNPHFCFWCDSKVVLIVSCLTCSLFGPLPTRKPIGGRRGMYGCVLLIFELVKLNILFFGTPPCLDVPHSCTIKTTVGVWEIDFWQEKYLKIVKR